MKTTFLLIITLFTAGATTAYAEQISISDYTLRTVSGTVWGWLALVCGTWILTTWMKCRATKKKGGEN